MTNYRSRTALVTALLAAFTLVGQLVAAQAPAPKTATPTKVTAPPRKAPAPTTGTPTAPKPAPAKVTAPAPKPTPPRPDDLKSQLDGRWSVVKLDRDTQKTKWKPGVFVIEFDAAQQTWKAKLVAKNKQVETQGTFIVFRNQVITVERTRSGIRRTRIAVFVTKDKKNEGRITGLRFVKIGTKEQLTLVKL